MFAPVGSRLEGAEMPCRAIQTPLWALAILLGGALFSCDSKPELPPPPAEDPAAKAAEEANARPTTQELISGEQVKTSLQVMPFTMQVPKSWKVKPAAGSGVPTLTGPTPTSDAQIQLDRLSQRNSLIDDKYAERFIAGAQKLATQPTANETARIRTIGPARIVEIRSFGPTNHFPAIDSTGKQIAPTSTSMTWKLTAFVQTAGSTQAYQISFVDLTKEQFEMDKELLEKIVASLEYDAASTN
jgi:hypothetical protein